MSNNKESSIDWLSEIIRFANKELYAEMFEEIAEAKAMHKEEIVKTYIKGYEDKDFSYFDHEQYYNETFGE